MLDFFIGFAVGSVATFFGIALVAVALLRKPEPAEEKQERPKKRRTMWG